MYIHYRCFKWLKLIIKSINLFINFSKIANFLIFQGFTWLQEHKKLLKGIRWKMKQIALNLK